MFPRITTLQFRLIATNYHYDIPTHSFKLVGQGGLSKKAQPVQEGSRCKGIQSSTSKEEIKCVCLNARSIINKKKELNIMVDEIKPHIIGITESWANNDITDAELGL